MRAQQRAVGDGPDADRADGAREVGVWRRIACACVLGLCMLLPAMIMTDMHLEHYGDAPGPRPYRPAGLSPPWIDLRMLQPRHGPVSS